MNSDKMKSLVKYVADMKAKLDSPLPEKHKQRPKEYRDFLNREIRIHTNKIEEAKIVGSK